MNAPTPRLTIRLLGALEIISAGLPLKADRRKALALLVYLLVTRQRQSRETLATLFWPDYPAERAFAYLRRTLWELNQALGSGWVDSQPEGLTLLTPGELTVDLWDFSRGLSAWRSHKDLPALESAVTLVAGDFLAGFSLKDSPAFDDWQFFQAEALRRQYGEALASLAETLPAHNRLPHALEYATRYLALDRLNEAAHRLLMRLLVLDGQRNAALRQYQECLRLLDEELGVEPEAETRRLHQQILAETLPVQGQTAALLHSVELPRPVSDPLTPGLARLELPTPTTDFIGRETELSQISDLIANPACRLLTLIGPGGIGKTRLSLEIAHRQANQYAQGVCFVPLAGLTNSAGLVYAIADALHLHLRGDDPQNQMVNPQVKLVNYLRMRQLLLVLDNFEHLIDGAGLLSSLLAEAPRLRLLVTSRQRLNLAEEWTLPITGMNCPPAGAAEPAALETYSAVRLFVQRARHANPAFSITAADAPAIVHICHLLQGLPLGIELAAAWIRLLSPAEIAAEIARNLDFLSGGPRDNPARHQSLRAVFEHSWALLQPADQAIFSRLSVFIGGFTRQAAQIVAGADLHTLLAFVDRSLIRTQEGGRFDLHELLRQYATEKLSEAPSFQSDTLDLYCAYYLGWIDRHHLALRGADQKRILEEIDCDLANILKAWELAVSSHNWELVRLALPALNTYLFVRSSLEPGYRSLAHLVTHLEAQPNRSIELDALLAASLAGCYELSRQLEYLGQPQTSSHQEYFDRTLAMLARMEPGLPRCQAWLNLNFGIFTLEPHVARHNLQECLDVFTQVGYIWEQALTWLAWAEFYAYVEFNQSAARHAHQESLALFTRIGSPWGKALALNGMGRTAYAAGEYANARQFVSTSLEIYKELDLNWNEVNCYLVLGQAATAEGNYAEARLNFEKGIRVLLELGDREGYGAFLDALGYTEVLSGNYAAAEEHFKRSLEIYDAVGYTHGKGMATANLGDIARQRGEYDQACALYQRGYDILLEIDAWWGMLICSKKFGQLEALQGQFDSARRMLHRALLFAIRIERPSEALEIFCSLALLLTHQGKLEQAAVFLTLVIAHPATTQDARAEAHRQFAELTPQFSPEHLQQIQQAAAHRDPLQLAQDYLDQLGFSFS